MIVFYGLYSVPSTTSAYKYCRVLSLEQVSISKTLLNLSFTYRDIFLNKSLNIINYNLRGCKYSRTVYVYCVLCPVKICRIIRS